MRVWRRVRVSDVEVETALTDLIKGNLPRELGLLPILPPRLLRLELLDAHRLRLGVRDAALGVRMLVVPHLLRRTALAEKQDVGLDARVRSKHTLGHTY